MSYNNYYFKTLLISNDGSSYFINLYNNEKQNIKGINFNSFKKLKFINKNKNNKSKDYRKKFLIKNES